MNHPMGPVALAELGGPDQSPHPLRDRRYLELLLPAGVRAAGWGLPEFCRPPEDPTAPSREYLPGFRKVAAGPSGPPAGRASRKPLPKHTGFLFGRRLPGLRQHRALRRIENHPVAVRTHGRNYRPHRAVCIAACCRNENHPVPVDSRRRGFRIGG